ncbi:RagB/SusD family nutrient uptake outer membrane protein [Formosa haliotis]|uniref:RagB/SusD family nutrient uptake outer membrane protein n=1 Tax=Formosa haliotis TaxID=1555194 RepID=UPI000824A2BA|nr:RagB/SusD family nutrient uptake outer membrane protein [Formosa haliotis]
MKKILIITLISVTGLLSSCSDFLEEEMVSTLTQERYDTKEGIEELVNGAYEGLRYHHNYEWSYTLTNYGTDEFTNGGGRDHVQWNTYSPVLDPLETRNLAPLWDNMYAQINLCNIGIQNIPVVLGDPLDEELMKTRLGEVYFLRGFDYLKLIEQFGGVPITTSPISEDTAEFPRASKEDVFNLIIEDLTRAEELLPATPGQVGRITKTAAQHFLAKVYLNRASEQNADLTQSTDLENAAKFAEMVISSRTLAPDYNDIFNYTSVNGPNETLSEIILSSQFDDTQALLGRYGNQTHMYFLSVYRNFPGMTRNLYDGREFQRLKPTDFALDVFDRKNDSRFYKSFQTSYTAVNTNGIPNWSATNAPDPSLVGQPKFGIGDTAIVMLINDEEDNRFTPEYKDSFAPLMLVRYTNDSEGTDYDVSTYPSLSKYRDPFRTSFNDAKGTRDGILARLGETYLIAAEAYGRMGDYGTALNYINQIRSRAAFKEGEARSSVYYLAEQVAEGDETSTLSAMQATEAYFTPGTQESAGELYPPGVSSKPEMFIHFVLNERARELMGEFHRWVDLARTNTLVSRAKAFNPEAAPNVDQHHALRPIPQSYLESVTVGGNLLPPDERNQMQNPGY